MNTLFALYSYLIENKLSHRSSFFRARKYLKMKGRDVPLAPWLATSTTYSTIEFLCLHAPLLSLNHLPHHIKSALRPLPKHLPNDRRFFQMVQEQLKIWKTFEDQSVESFLHSQEAKVWARRRKRLKRNPLFELDQPYRQPKRAARLHEIKVKSLLIENPLLRLEDLRALQVKNVQSIYARTAELPEARAHFLKELSHRFASKRLLQRSGDNDPAPRFEDVDGFEAE